MLDASGLRTSEGLHEIAAALAKAQAALEPAVKGSTNPHFRSKYADLAACLDAVRGPLGAQGLALVQGPWRRGDVVGLTTRLLHTSGQWIECECSVTLARVDAQAVGSALTYLRRYSLSAMTGLAAADDDGNAATAAAPEPAAAPPRLLTAEEREALVAAAKAGGWTLAKLKKAFDVKELTDIPHTERYTNAMAYLVGQGRASTETPESPA